MGGFQSGHGKLNLLLGAVQKRPSEGLVAAETAIWWSPAASHLRQVASQRCRVTSKHRLMGNRLPRSGVGTRVTQQTFANVA